jgi:phosphate transport system protein
MTTFFEHNLENVKSKLLLMGQLANESVNAAIQALVDGDSVLAKAVRAKDEEIDDLENELSESVTTFLSTHAPVAADLRLLVATMKISHEIERIGDETKRLLDAHAKLQCTNFIGFPKWLILLMI